VQAQTISPATLGADFRMRSSSLDSSQAPTPADPALAGLTVLATLGLGIQSDSFFDETAAGLSGINVGAGWFLNEKYAVLFRTSTTYVAYQDEIVGHYAQISGVVGGSVQYWLTTRLAAEGGLGMGFWRSDEGSERDLGMILGASWVVLDRGRHDFTVGFEYAPAYLESGTVHNSGVTVGYQYRR
jgi:hypothetical protein